MKNERVLLTPYISDLKHVCDFSLGFEVQDWGFRVAGWGVGVEGLILGFRILGLGLRVEILGLGGYLSDLKRIRDLSFALKHLWDSHVARSNESRMVIQIYCFT